MVEIFSVFGVVFVAGELKESLDVVVLGIVRCAGLGGKLGSLGGKWVKRSSFSLPLFPGIQMSPNFGTCSTKM